MIIKLFFPATNTLSEEMAEEAAEHTQTMYLTNNIYCWVITVNNSKF